MTTITEWLLARSTNKDHRTVRCLECDDPTQDSTEYCSRECAERAYEEATGKKPYGLE